MTKSGYDCITTYVDRFSKRIHLIPSKGSDTATDVADDFFKHIFRLHGLPDSLISNRDHKFTSKFWSRLMHCCGIRLKMSTSRHPQTDGSTEIVNRMVGNYLRCYCSFKQNDWDSLLTSAEFAYNSAVVESMGMSPFEADLGWKITSPLDSVALHSDNSIQTVTEFRTRLEESFKSASFAHRLAQSRQAVYNCKCYSPPSYQIGDSVFLTNKLFTDASSSARPSQKFSIRRAGPFKVTEIIGPNAVRLDLPKGVNIHPVVHVEHTTHAFSQPDDISAPCREPTRPFIDSSGEYVIEVSEILSHRRRGQSWQLLTQFKNTPTHEVEWKPLRNFLDSDGTITSALHRYIVSKNILSRVH